MMGVEFLTEVKGRCPEAMRILLTGYADLQAIEASINEGEVFRYLMKPCPPEDLKKAIALAVEAARATDSAELSPASENTQSKPAELIPFPGNRRSKRPAATVHQLPARPAAAHKPPQPAPRPANDDSLSVDVLVFSLDKTLHEAVEEVVKEHQVFHARSLDQALSLLGSHPIGVMVTDISGPDTDVETLTKTLKLEVPELVTIVASERSDAQALISLINEGQIYRFLLKPVSRGQCRLWVASAVKKFAELSGSEGAVARHRVMAEEDGELPSVLEAVRSVLGRLRARLQGS